ncbi:rhodanese-like domain-containing protein [Hoeflea sp. WL0058]|uniref:Rhodanese-like domain-containing protein n=1 Tax=Flavimaribacter sediminis TaxID=2865987 RepID=A0AAE2ZT29_9HYPH|nr:rhodanese-like domain-containing protein [Flavimaribacter sediminis]MBW8640497.1 rhodanese-like domain-containing protein [Flavimaribacter sediminis]
MQTEQLGDTVFETWTPEEVYEALTQHRIVLIDVRTPQEFMFEHIEGALLSPMAFFSAQDLPSQQGKPVVLHCGSGVRSGRVAKMCSEAGVDKIAHMDGGFGKWKEARLPYIGTEMSTGSPKRMQME